VIILQLFPGLLTNGVADIDELPLNKADAGNLSQEERNEYVSMVTSRQKKLACTFREHMTKGQTYDTPNPYRNYFYTEVTNAAKEVNFPSFPVLVRMTVFSSLWKGTNKSR
jgi:hypothetical protein